MQRNHRHPNAMFIDYIILGIISLATLIWAFTTLPDDTSSNDDDHGGTNVGGDSYPTNTPPTVVEDPADENEDPALDAESTTTGA